MYYSLYPIYIYALPICAYVCVCVFYIYYVKSIVLSAQYLLLYVVYATNLCARLYHIHFAYVETKLSEHQITQ